MELPFRTRGDELLVAGEMTRIRQRLQGMALRHDLTTVIAYAFDHRTRMLPFIFADMQLVPAGVRAIGSALLDAGFTKTRIVLQQWNRNFSPSRMRLDGRIPDLFMVSCMQLHTAACDALLRDVCRIDPRYRPLIIVGGARMIYQPWEIFGGDPQVHGDADVAVTGEEYVLLNLLEVLLAIRASNQTLRAAFLHARDEGLLDAIPGLVYPRPGTQGKTVELVDTGIQRLLGDLDELPHPVLGYGILEPPGPHAGLSARALPASQMQKYSRAAALVLTAGCKYHCPYCSIPAYNQRLFRSKSAARISDEIEALYSHFGFFAFFGTDDNFFNDRERALEIAETLAGKVLAGSRAHCRAIWGTQVTVHDTLGLQDHLAVLRKAGLVALWLGVEDMTASLVNKGQNAERTLEAFRLLRSHGIFPIPMLMHHDAQPLYTRKSEYGLLNQVRKLRRAGALNVQILMITPVVGARDYESAYLSGLVFESVAGAPVEPHQIDGIRITASLHPRPWIKQLNILGAYIYFFNPLRLVAALICSKSRLPFADAVTWPPADVFHGLTAWQKFRLQAPQKLQAHLIDAGLQLVGMGGLIPTLWRALGWTIRLIRGNIKRHTRPPNSRLPICSPNGTRASHAPADIRPTDAGQPKTVEFAKSSTLTDTL